ncbi:phosphoglucomutase/phosphomannomutase family protein [Thermincola potens]|uniref:Phosphoglucomutase n=1 Tax=Thermincola potens (strain JR) TaxID=635013 RepID=D5X9L5_THEPJ|nr:phosphoglucomutase/phosphomannomutase family protein [Thermincola potens]ADG81086.1 phosphoglucomutase/phosphomannomutase alpha/beta/alpha domain I [Thermincola potens JR]
MEIKFGTDGWRGVIGYDFTAGNVSVVAQALADYLLSRHTQPLCVIGYDTRFMSDIFAREIAQVLAGNGIKVLLAEKPVTSPVLSFATRELGAAGGVMVTASHNPPVYNGIKFKGPYGGSALPETVAAIEDKLSARVISRAPTNTSNIETFNPEEKYINHLMTIVDINKIINSGITFAVDPMYGSAQGYFQQIFAACPSLVQEIHSEINPSFGGINPEPIAKNLGELSNLVSSQGYTAGLALDGDGDRLGVICSNGIFMNSHQIFALLLKYLVEFKHLKGAVVKTFSTSGMIDLLAASYGLAVHETPIGFKYICDLFLSKDILIGGEESGGIGIKGHLPERDGILCGLLLLEYIAETGQLPEQLLQTLFNHIGSYYYDRRDVPVSPQAKARFNDAVLNNPPETIAGLAVTEIKTLDGIKFCFADKGWLLFRFSGTEPLLRLYAEASCPAQVQKLLHEAQLLIDDIEK